MVWISPNALEQADWKVYIGSVPSLGKNCRVIQNNCHTISPPIGRGEIIDLFKPWGIASQDRMAVWIQSNVPRYPTLRYRRHSGSDR